MSQLTKENDPELGEGFQIIRLHISADPEKDEAWAAKAKQEYSTEDWEREFELKPVGILETRPVFGDYKKTFHESDSLVWKPSAGRVIYRCWDFGKVHPACEFMQVNGLEKNFIGEVAPDNVLEETFVQLVLAHSNQNYPKCNFLDWVDVSGRNEDRWGNSSMKTLRSYGISPKGKDQTIEEGILQMGKELVLTTGGRPCIMVNPKACPRLAAAMRGGYKRNKKGEIIKDGIHDHYIDAARYGIMGSTFEKGKTWDSTRQKMINQYNKFPKHGKDLRR
jgi:hypothetical protein